jgi:subtilisin-like proprotein convertase family protein
VQVFDHDAYILNNPNLACGDMALSYSGYGDADAMVPLPDAAMPLTWSSYPTDASMITYDTNPAPEGGQIVFFCFNYLAVDQTRVSLLENSVLWLLTPEFGSSSVSGQVTLQGEVDFSGVTVSAIPGGGSVVTGADGTYTLPGLFAGPYQIRVEKTNWGTQVTDVSLSEGEHLTDINFDLSPTSELDVCSYPGLAISDYNTVSDAMPVVASGTISEVEVFVDITHTYQGDLIVTLTSPLGTDVVLHNRTGGSDDDIYGWYPTELDPDEDLGVYTGEELTGDWTLTVADEAGGDQGTFNAWCLHFIYDDDSVAAVSTPKMVVALYDNYPNPFNPITNIKFDLPKAGRVRLDIFDVSGRLVRTLVDENRVAASHSVTWDGTDNRGGKVASGAYYYRLQAGGRVITHKMMLVK